MHVLTLIQVSAAAILPLGFFFTQESNGVHSNISSAVPEPRASADHFEQTKLSAATPASIAPPERLSLAKTDASTNQLPPVPAVPAVPSELFPSIKVSPSSPPELSRLPLDKIIERTAGPSFSSTTTLSAKPIKPELQPVKAVLAPPVAVIASQPTVPPTLVAATPVSENSVMLQIAPAPQPEAQLLEPSLREPQIATSAATSAQPTAPANLLALERQVNTELNTSSPVAPAGADASYILGVGDQLQISFFNVPEYSGTYQVLVDGSLNLPMVGSVTVSGLTLQQAEETIAARYSNELRNPKVMIGLVKARPIQVGVVGEVGQPGFYTLTLAEGSQFPSVVQAIQAAGGANQTANLHQVEVRRQGRGAPLKVNLWDLLQNGNLSQNISLRDGDTIMVPATAELSPQESSQLADSNLAAKSQALDIALVGEVTRPGAYKLGAGGTATPGATGSSSGRPTLTQAIQTAGGVTPLADIRQVQVHRVTRNGSEQVINVDLWQLVSSGDLNQDVILQQGDRIIIPPAKELTSEESVRLAATNITANTIKVNVVGEVASPGTVEIPASSTLSQAVVAAGGLTRRANREVRLIRMSPNGTLTQTEIKFDTAQGIDPQKNPLLRSNDIIVVRRTGFAQFSDTLGDVLNPIFRVLPLRNLLF
jgi:protein involved in polysaccharide export with SLBB domain